MTQNEAYVRKWCEGDSRNFDSLTAMEKLRALCEWRLGDPDWADRILDAAKEFGVQREDVA